MVNLYYNHSMCYLRAVVPLLAAVAFVVVSMGLVAARMRPPPTASLPARALAASALPPLAAVQRDDDFLLDHNPLPTAGRLDRRDLEIAIEKVRSELNRCKPEAVPEAVLLTVQMTILPSGQVQTASVLPSASQNDNETGTCVANLLRSATFPAFQDPTTPIEWTLPVRLE